MMSFVCLYLYPIQICAKDRFYSLVNNAVVGLYSMRRSRSCFAAFAAKKTAEQMCVF